MGRRCPHDSPTPTARLCLAAAFGSLASGNEHTPANKPMNLTVAFGARRLSARR
jgi:hypothetical protein